MMAIADAGMDALLAHHKKLIELWGSREALSMLPHSLPCKQLITHLGYTVFCEAEQELAGYILQELYECGIAQRPECWQEYQATKPTTG